MASVSEDSFYYGPALEAFGRISSLAKSTGELPTYSELCTDPVISEESRRTLLKTKEPPAQGKISSVKLVRGLEKYRKLRGLYFQAESTLKALQEPKVDLDVMLDEQTNTLTKLRASADKKNEIHTIGYKGSDYLFKEAMYGKGITLVPTGFAAWDTVNGGFPETGLVTLAGSTGGGKTTLALQMMKNMAERGFDVALVSLEMTEIEVTYRLLSNVGEVPVTKLLRKAVTKGEKKRIKKGYKRFKAKLKKLKSKYSIWAPDEEITIEDALFNLKPYGYKVIIVDYASLLSTGAMDDDWKALKNISRTAKRFANANKTLIILLAQINMDGTIRYSKAIAENSDVLWAWSYTDESRETGLIEFRPLKARNFNPAPFALLHDYTYMKIGDTDDRTIKKLREQSGEVGDKRREKLNKLERDLSVDIEDDDDD